MDNNGTFKEHKPLILAVSDDPETIRKINNILTIEGYRVAVANNEQQALTMMKNLLPDIIILDIIMSGTDQIEACQKLKREAETDNIQVIVSIPGSDTDDMLRWFQVRADDYITKPFKLAELLARIQTHLEIKKNRDLISCYNRELKTEKEKHESTAQEKARLIEELRRKEENIKGMVIMDSLTGLYNRKYIIERLFQEVSEAIRYSQHLSVILFSIDHFKNINNIYGDRTGNEVLSEISAEIKNNLRKSDIAGRYSGDEFIIILPHTDNKGADNTANRLLKNIRRINWKYKDLTVTVSGGIGSLKKEKDSLIIREDKLIYELIRSADDLLYKAKQNGRDRIETGR